MFYKAILRPKSKFISYRPMDTFLVIVVRTFVFSYRLVVVDVPNDMLMKLMEKDSQRISRYRHYLDHQRSVMSAIHIPVHHVPYVDLADIKSVAKSIADEIKKQ
jgi:predicted RND superfamily exporter protein